MKEYFSVLGEFESRKTIEKSKFIAASARVTCEQEAKLFLQKIRGAYPDATHNCYAYVCDNIGSLMRFSDDGEPSGTAGLPILEVIKGKKLFETMVVVTRYFGGIKLGAGGLTRAYSGCAAENLAAAEKRLYAPCRRIFITVDYNSVTPVQRYVEKRLCTLENTEYGSEVRFTLVTADADCARLIAELTDCLQGRCKIDISESFYYPLEVK